MEAVKILKILQSRKAPLVKKRQAMRNTFGDYRAKMKKEQTKSAAGESPEIKIISNLTPPYNAATISTLPVI